jgi:hypothetical protein
MRKKLTKLALSRETLQRLDDLTRAQGGGPTWWIRSDGGTDPCAPSCEYSCANTTCPSNTDCTYCPV